MGKFRKKPVVIEAMLFDGSIACADKIEAWSGGATAARGVFGEGTVHPVIFIKTLEGEMRADAGDWIIRGVKNEFYPCKPDVFEATYEAVE